jgi:hypothetical protein
MTQRLGAAMTCLQADDMNVGLRVPDVRDNVFNRVAFRRGNSRTERLDTCL